MMLKLLYFCLSLSSFYICNEVTKLPGFTGQINFKQYSGAIEVDSSLGKNLHYWFVESQRGRPDDPVVLWMNGGPGCSSLLGMLSENGPFTLNTDAKTVSLNPYSWNLKANVVYLEAPAGVGFSWSTDAAGYVTDDAITAENNYAFLVGFFKEFPHLQANKFYIAGESYAGHYVPQLADIVLEKNSKGSFHINLQGTLSGNPCTNDLMDGNSRVTFIYDHALTGISEYDQADKACHGEFVQNRHLPACRAAVEAIQSGMKRINPYNIMAPCVGKGSPNGACFTHNNAKRSGVGSQTVVPCMNYTYAATYLNRADVQKALFVSPQVKVPWDICSQIITYHSNVSTVVPIYDKLVQKIRVLFYSGDVDSCVNYLGTEQAVRTIKHNSTPGPWTPWFVEDERGQKQVAGYGVTFGPQLKFITIKDAGHMVPFYKPKQALAFFESFLDL